MSSLSWFLQENISIAELHFGDCTDSMCISLTIIAPIMYVLGGCIIFCGNLLTILAVWRTEKLRTLQNLYIVSLAAADMLGGFVLFGVSTLHMRHLMPVTVHNKPLCMFGLTCWLTSCSASNASIILIALDRYYYIVRPFAYEDIMTGRRTKLAVIISWIISLAIGMGGFLFNNHIGGSTCYFVGVLDSFYQLISNTITFFAVFVTVCLLYGRIVILAYHQQRQVVADGKDGKDGHRAMWKYKMKNMRLLLTVCGLYFVFWMPYHVAFCNFMATGNIDSMTFLYLLGSANCCVNFIVYPCMNKDFRKAFATMLCPCRGRM